MPKARLWSFEADRKNIMFIVEGDERYDGIRILLR